MNSSWLQTRPGFLRSAAALLGVGAMVLSACTGAQGPTSQPSAGGASVGNVAAGSVPKNAFTIALRSDPASLDPAAATDLPGRVVTVNMYESLIRYEGKPPLPVPNLAESITASADSRVYTVKLRPNIKFHDGSDLDAAAVAFSMDRVLTIGKGGAAAFKQVLKPGDTKAVDKLTVQFNLSSPSAVFPGTLSFFFVVNPKVVLANKLATGPYGANGDYAEQYLQTHDAGSGPYQLNSRTPNAEMQLAAVPGYWRGWKDNQYGTFTVKIVPEVATVALLLRQGDVDGAYESYPSEVYDSVGVANVQVYTDLGTTPMYLFMNNEKAPTNNIKVRQAIAYAFDYQQAVQNVLPGAQRLPGPLPAGMWSAVSTPAYETNLDKAKALLAEAGVKPGTLTLDFGAIGGPASIQTKIALLLQDGLAKVGIGLSITNHAWADVLAQTAKPETTKHLYAIQLSADYADPDALLFQGWASAGHGAWSGAQWYTNAKVDDLIQQGRTTVDVAKRLATYQQAQQQIISDSPAVFVFNTPIRVALNKSVGGYNFVVAYYNYQIYGLFKKS